MCFKYAPIHREWQCPCIRTYPRYTFASVPFVIICDEFYTFLFLPFYYFLYFIYIFLRKNNSYILGWSWVCYIAKVGLELRTCHPPTSMVQRPQACTNMFALFYLLKCWNNCKDKHLLLVGVYCLSQWNSVFYLLRIYPLNFFNVNGKFILKKISEVTATVFGGKKYKSGVWEKEMNWALKIWATVCCCEKIDCCEQFAEFI